jgi:hypothetical protein
MARVVLKSAGVKALLNSGETRAMLTGKAGPVLSAAQSSAPVASGEYRASLHLEQDTTDRAVVRVVSDAPHAMIVEANTGNLARALDAAG